MIGGIAAWAAARWAGVKASPALKVIVVLAAIVLLGALSLKLIVRDAVKDASTAAVSVDRSQSSVRVLESRIEAAEAADNQTADLLANVTADIEQTRQDVAPVLAKHGKNTVSPARQAYIESLRRRAQKKD